MQVTLAHIGNRSGAKDALDAQVQSYLERCSAFARCQIEGYRTEDAMLVWLERQQGRTPALAVLMDSRGPQMDSEAFASWLGHGATREANILFLLLVRPAAGQKRLASGLNCCFRWAQ